MWLSRTWGPTPTLAPCKHSASIENRLLQFTSQDADALQNNLRPELISAFLAASNAMADYVMLDVSEQNNQATILLHTFNAINLYQLVFCTML